MKVTNNRINVSKIYNDNKLSAIREKEKLNSKYDSVEISKAGQELAKYLAISDGIKDVRVNTVEDIKSKIKSGKYNVSSEQIASGIAKAIKGENI